MKRVISLNISDIHLGCRRLFADWMVANLLELILPYIPKINLFVIQGDLFDTAVGFSDGAAPHIIRFITRLISECDRHNVTMRILRGTFSHDRTQCAVLPEIHFAMRASNDLRYVDKISVEYIEDLDLRVAYVPDNVPYHSSEEAVNALKDVMSSYGWDSVDYVYLHGSFAHTLPPVAAKSVKVLYREDQFDFVKRFVVVGHIHQHSVKGKIINNGSVDRLAHNEEEPKGFVLIDDDGSEADITFVENTKATQFLTYDMSDIPDEQSVLKTVEERIADLRRDVQTQIKIKHPRPDLGAAVVQHLRIAYPAIKFTHERIATEMRNEEGVDDALAEDVVSATHITVDTLPDLLQAPILSRFGTCIERKEIVRLLQLMENGDDLSRRTGL